MLQATDGMVTAGMVTTGMVTTGRELALALAHRLIYLFWTAW